MIETIDENIKWIRKHKNTVGNWLKYHINAHNMTSDMLS